MKPKDFAAHTAEAVLAELEKQPDGEISIVATCGLCHSDILYREFRWLFFRTAVVTCSNPNCYYYNREMPLSNLSYRKVSAD